jgi:hypothetical protein
MGVTRVKEFSSCVNLDIWNQCDKMDVDVMLNAKWLCHVGFDNLDCHYYYSFHKWASSFAQLQPCH